MRVGIFHSEAIKRAISKAMKGNKNAEKWTEQIVKGLLVRMVDFAQREGAHLKVQLLLEFKIYNRSWFKDMKRKFKHNETVSPLLCALDMICEINSYKAAAFGKANTNIIKMNLATHYNWSTKARQDIEPI